MVRRAKEYYEFCEFRVDVSERLLFRDGKTIPLTPKVFDTLLYLVENSGHILSKDEVMGHVWADSIVEEANLTRNISVLRKALGEGPDQLQYIETIPWRGYRFIPDVRRIGDDNEELLIEEHTSSRVVIEHESNLPETAARAERAGPLSRWWLAAILTGCVAAVTLITASILYSIRGGDDTRSTGAVSSVAVLPLENLSGDPAQEYFADGMTEALINNLARLRALKVISRASVMRYKGTTKSLPEVAGELGVDAVITGSVQRSGDRVRVTAQMINATTDTHLWAREYDRELADILKLEGEIAREVAQEIHVQFTSDERMRLASARTIDPRAHEAYLLGRFHFSKNDLHHLRLAVEHFERAVALAPDFAPAYAGLSDTWVARGLLGTVDFRETEAPARSAALKAIELDEQLAEGHLALASVKQHFDWDWSGAEREIMRALELDPGSLVAHTEYAYLLANVGRFDEAIRQGRVVVQLDPLSWSAHSALGRILYRARLYDEAIPSLQKAAELEPQGLTPHYRLGDVYTQLGRYDEALSAYERVGKAMSKGGYPHAGIARLYALMGKREEAKKMVRGLKDNPYIIASVHAALGDRDEAFRILEKAVAENQLMTPVKVEPPLESLHSDPRWKALLDRMNLPTE
jgi:TolB-like protein/DNA-binding winged helix-turn-helix (wHTH) protein/Flp pilus assembly protein TadD